jgi:hypothetical protein
MIASHRSPVELQGSQLQEFQRSLELTRVLLANIRHDLRSPFNVNLHTAALEPFDHHTHPPQTRDKLKSADYTKFKEMSMLGCNSQKAVHRFNA